MTENAQSTGAAPVSTPWWLVLIEAIAAIVVGLLLLINPGSTLAVLVRLLGFYFLITGILSIISIFVDRSALGWKLFSGILGVLAGIVIIDYPLWSTLVVPVTFLLVIAIFAIIIGFVYLVQAFRGAGWGRGLLGVLTILLGIVILARPLLAAISLPLVLGILLLAGGVLALISAFSLRTMQKSVPEPAVHAAPAQEPLEAAPVEPAPVETAPQEPEETPVAATDSDLEFLGLSDREELEKFHRPLEYIEGIGEVYAGKLAQAGIETPLDLLRAGSTPEGRSDVAKRSDISGLLVLEWINHIDLYRIKGVGSEYADLMEESGVDTVMELAHRNPENLFEKMSSVNELKNLVRRLPSQNQVVAWVEQAKTLPRVIHY